MILSKGNEVTYVIFREESGGPTPPLSLYDGKPAPTGVAAPGVSPLAARGDHVHAIPDSVLGGITAAQSTADAALAKAVAAGAMGVPYPDVWIPFSDDLRMLAGRNNGTRKIKINGADATVEDGATVSFSRASTATYIDKSGVLRTAAIDEPRFEKEGLLIEGQSTNLIPNSESSSICVNNVGQQSVPES